MAFNAPKPVRVEILDLLRLVAVLAVLMFHYGFRGALPDQSFTAVSLPALAPFAKYGGLGVQMFFVISGFVIAYSAERRTWREFGIARVGRIYPAFIVCMTLTFAATLAVGAPQFQATLRQWLVNFVIAAPALKQPFMDGAYWSLVDEMIFYGWIAVLIATGAFRRHIDVIIIAWLAIALANHELHSGAVERVFLTDQSGFFAAGLIFYEMYSGRRDATIKLLLVLAAVVAVSQSLDVVTWQRAHFQVAYDDRIQAALALAVIATVGLGLRVRRVPLPTSVIVGIGGVTYPLYLLHQNIGYMVFNTVGGRISPTPLIGLTAAAMIVLAWLVWRYIERPGQRLLKRLLSRIAALLDGAVAPHLKRLRRV